MDEIKCDQCARELAGADMFASNLRTPHTCNQPERSKREDLIEMPPKFSVPSYLKEEEKRRILEWAKKELGCGTLNIEETQ